MDCGPAALKCLLEGFGIPVSYGRLREACQTDVDGTSIDTIEEAAVQLGLEAEQVMVPVDHLFLPEAAALPAMVVVHLASSYHFVVVWRRHGRVVQVMDPATGRRWPTCRRFLDEVYVHTMPISSATWRAWAGTHEFLGALRRRWATLGLSRSAAERASAAALADPDWGLLATLDATTRMVHAMVRAGGLRRGRQATGVFEAFYERARQEGLATTQTIPEAYWMVRPAPPGPDGEAQLLLRGADVRVRGRPPAAPVRAGTGGCRAPGWANAALELVAALAGHRVRRGANSCGCSAPTASWPRPLGAALALAAGSVVVEVLFFRGLFDLGRELGLVEQRLVPWSHCLCLSRHCCSSSCPWRQGCSAWGDGSKRGCASPFWRRSPASTTATSRAGRPRTWPSAAAVCTSCASCRISAGSSCGSSASLP